MIGESFNNVGIEHMLVRREINISCQNLEFCNTKSDLTCPVYIFILQEPFTSVNR